MVVKGLKSIGATLHGKSLGARALRSDESPFTQEWMSTASAELCLDTAMTTGADRDLNVMCLVELALGGTVRYFLLLKKYTVPRASKE